MSLRSTHVSITRRQALLALAGVSPVAALLVLSVRLPGAKR